eukprot:scaffold123709_cov69-Phaeocystis_antarctica.AAC.4
MLQPLGFPLDFRASEQLVPVTGRSQHETDALPRRGDRLGVTQLIVSAVVPANDRAARRD